jgi:hypothetical protein
MMHEGQTAPGRVKKLRQRDERYFVDFTLESLSVISRSRRVSKFEIVRVGESASLCSA